MRLIDADAAKKALVGWDTDPTDEEIEYTIDELPTIEAAPVVHGRWDGPFRVDANHNGYKCSVCGYFGVPGWVACPKCAARMGDGSKATTTPAAPTTGSNHRVCKHCNTAVIGMEEYAECPECGKPFEEVAI